MDATNGYEYIHNPHTGSPQERIFWTMDVGDASVW
jgi:hypothetical protein